jgi:hypothetical protein
MKMVMITYNEAIDLEAMEALKGCGIQNYTKVNAVYGKGEASGTHLGTDVWPGRNNILYAACDDAQAIKLISCIKQLRSKLAKEGIKAFVWALDAV